LAARFQILSQEAAFNLSMSIFGRTATATRFFTLFSLLSETTIEEKSYAD